MEYYRIIRNRIIRRRKEIALCVSVIILFFLMFEMALRTFFPLESDPFFNRGIISFGDVFRTSQNSELGYEPIPFVESNEGGINYKFNSRGLRDHEYSYNKPKRVYRILVFGDSVTMGFGVQSDEIYTEQLEKLLNQDESGYEVINFGVGGYNTWQEFEYLIKEGMKYEPDMVIFGFLYNDIEPDYTKAITKIEKGNVCKISFTGIKLPCSMIDSLRKIRTLTFIKYRINNILTIKEEKDTLLNDYYREDSVDIFDGIFNNISNFSESKGIDVLFVIFPVIADDYENYPYSRIHEGVIGKMGEFNLQYVDLLEPYSKHSQPLYLSKVDRCHPNAEGHYIAAKTIYDHLKTVKR